MDTLPKQRLNGDNMSKDETYLVASASGQLGRQVLEALLKRGAEKIIATTRTPESLSDYARRGVEVRQADYNQPEGLAHAFRGATRLLIISTLGAGSRHAQHVAALEAAKAAGVRHVFYTSHACPEASVSVVAPDHAAMEKAILASGMTYTILRNYLYSENWLLMLPAVLESGALHGATGDGKVAWVSRRDCGEAAAGAMLQASQHENRIHHITGLQAYSAAEVVEIVSKLLDRRFQYVDMTPWAYKEWLIGKGVPPPHAHAFTSFEISNGSGEESLVTDTVRVLTGHDPESLEDYLRDSIHQVDPSKTLAVHMDKHLKV
jgi:NAD(P)H dehydrogenase (quinone)